MKKVFLKAILLKLNKIKKINNFIDIFTPSVRGNIKFKPLNLKQQREILDNLESQLNEEGIETQTIPWIKDKEN